MLRVFLISLVLLLPLLPVSAQSDLTEILRTLQAKTPKCVVLILDVSESMKVEGYNRKMRDAAEAILKEGLSDGDQVALFTFGAGYKKIFDETPDTPAARRKLLELLPLNPEPGEGTNIRQPHSEALRLARESGKTPYLVILTDSFNDPPKNTPEAYTEYQKYYTPGKLETYPSTPENRAYEELLDWMQASQGKTFGIGVEILPSGRPKERFKVAPTEATLATPEPTEPAQTTTSAPPAKEPFPTALVAALAGLGVLGALFAVLRPRPAPLRITGPAGARDFDVRGGAGLRLGGEGTAASLDAYPVAGTKETVATIKGGRGSFLLLPQPTTGTRVYHNGLPLEKPAPLRYGDELRVAVLDSNGSIARESRLKFSDPTKLV